MDTLLQYYEAIEQASTEMLQAARQGDWDRVVMLEGACAVLISRLKQAASSEQLDAEQHSRKVRVMQRILMNDAEIRALAEPCMDELGLLVADQSRAFLH